LNKKTFLITAKVVFVGIVLLVVVSCSQPDVSNDDKRAQSISNSIMCPICPGESIDQSQNALAVQMRSIVQKKIQEGFTDQEIKLYFAERYGEVVLLEPTRNGFNVFAWTIPLVALIIAAAAVTVALINMKKTKNFGQEFEVRNYMSDDIGKHRVLMEETKKQDKK